MATVNAARAGRVAGRQRGLAPGEKADLVRFRWDPDSHILTVKETIVAGRTVHQLNERSLMLIPRTSHG